MKKNPNRQNDYLKQIQHKFAKFRQRNPGKRVRIPDNYKRVALRALTQGHPCVDVAKATGVSKVSLYQWQRKRVIGRSPARTRKGVRAIELRLLENSINPKPHTLDLQTVLAAKEQEALACISFRSGAKMWLPCSTLTPDLFIALMKTLNDADGMSPHLKSDTAR